MPGASEHARKVKILNANWVAGTDGGDGQFEVMTVTDDDRTDAVPVSPASITALIALTQAGTVLVWGRRPPGAGCSPRRGRECFVPETLNPNSNRWLTVP